MKPTGANRKKQPNNQARTPNPHPLISTATTRQREVLALLAQRKTLTGIHRALNLAKSTVAGHLRALERKRLATRNDHAWQATQAGKELLEQPAGVRVGRTGARSKHANAFTVTITGLPRHWAQRQALQDLHAEIVCNHATNQWFLYFEDCTIRISPDARKLTIWVAEQTAHSFDAAQSKAWDRFVHYYQLIKQKGFSLAEKVEATTGEFANHDGFFARMATYTNTQGFRIETTKGSFWVDYSTGEAEEETDDEAIATRMEQLAKSALTSSSDFDDLDKLIEITKNLVRLQAAQHTNQAQSTLPRYTKCRSDKLR